jgi:hypothetical protein
MLNIKFSTTETNKSIPKEWTFKMATEKLASLWRQLLDYEIKLKSKKSSSPKPLNRSRVSNTGILSNSKSP